MIPYITLIKIPGAKSNSYDAKIPRKNSRTQKIISCPLGCIDHISLKIFSQSKNKDAWSIINYIYRMK